MSKEPLVRCTWNKNNKYYDSITRITSFKNPLNYKFNSTIYHTINDQFQYFPFEIKSLYINKEISVVNGIDFITGDITYENHDIGKVWIPSIAEVFGNCIVKCNNEEKSNQYDFFKSYSETGFKFNKGTNNKQLLNDCWLRNHSLFNNGHAYFVDCGYVPNLRLVTDTCQSVLCLRLKINV